MAAGVQMELNGLVEFRHALDQAADATPRELTSALKSASKKVAMEARGYAPRKSGKLAKGYKPYARSGKTKVETGVRNKVPYAPGAEFGMKGKWKGFRHLGARAKRILFKAWAHWKDRLPREVFREVSRVAQAHGWLMRK